MRSALVRSARFLSIHPVTVALLGCLLLTAPASAKADYFEGFENTGFVSGSNHGPDNLIAAGWVFRNQSDPVSSGTWTDNGFAFQGSAALRIDATVGDWINFNDATASSWAILPAISGQVAGDEMRFQLSSLNITGLTTTGSLEVRYSPSGGTDTGNGPTDIGDFTVLLADIPDPNEFVWTEYVLPLAGTGRLALRFRIPPAATEQTFWGYFQIDNLSVGALEQGPPIPTPGQTVHWTLEMSPIQITQLVTIPAGGTIIVDPGVVVDLALTAKMTVHGDLIGNGTPTQPVTLQGLDRIEVFGNLDLDEAIVALQLHVLNAGAIAFRNVSLINGSALWTGGSTTQPAFLDIEQCTFDNSLMWIGSCALRMTNTTFTNTFVSLGNIAAPFLENVTIDGAPQDGLNLLSFLQPLWLDDITVTNSAGAGLNLTAVNVRVGSNVMLSGNLYPAQGGGFLPGSTLPATGNVNNYVLADPGFDADIGGEVGAKTWADTGIPYTINSFLSAGPLDILPGVRVLLGPAAEFWGVNGFVKARGTPDNPVIFERLNPAQAWQGLQKFHRFENCIIDGGQVGARFNSITFPGFIDNCLIQNCDFGTQNDVFVRKTRFINNDVGSWSDNLPDALDGSTGANSFTGNGVGVQWQSQLIDAPNNWWNHPTGANAPDNPGGLGDSASPGVTTVPFLTSAPDFSDNPPHVQLNRPSSLFEPGSKVILTWTSSDDNAVVGHRIEFEHPLAAGAIEIVADGLSGTQQAYEWLVPDIGFTVNGKLPRVRVVAIDTVGQEGWDAHDPVIPSGEVGGMLNILSDLSGPFTAGVPAGGLCWDATGLTGPLGTFVISVVLDADDVRVPTGSTFSSCLGSGTAFGIPFVSTDSARVQITVQGTSNRVGVFYSEPFAIRPDTRIGDAPPQVTMLSPLPGQLYGGGADVPITWTASDDLGLRGFDIQASYDAGHTWHVLAADLPPTDTSFDWRLPPTSGIFDVRVRVIAVDQRFQNTSDGADTSFSIGGAANPWTNLGGGTVGANGAPTLVGSGPLDAGSVTSLSLVAAPTNGLMLAWLSLTSVPVNYFGGTIHANPPTNQFLFFADPAGSFSVSTTWPSGIPAGTQAWFQFIVQDPSVPAGLTLSNAVRATTP
jgi:hypothetical protein